MSPSPKRTPNGASGKRRALGKAGARNGAVRRIAKPLSKRIAPTRSIERELWDRGYEVVVGIDEVGRGAWAGPLTVGAAVLPRERRLNGIRDSKMLTERDRERLYDRVAGWCQTWGVGHASQAECDELGMADAQRLATKRALEQLSVTPTAAIVDGSWDFVSPHVAHVERVIKADARCLVVSAASILAKVTRDRIMREQAEHFPAWSFDTNKGYPCATHLAALQAWGPSTIHRRSWVFMDNYVPWPSIHRIRRIIEEEAIPTLFDELEELDEGFVEEEFVDEEFVDELDDTLGDEFEDGPATSARLESDA